MFSQTLLIYRKSFLEGLKPERTPDSKELVTPLTPNQQKNPSDKSVGF